VWGPIAGYFQKKKAAASLALVPIEDAGFSFDISMGVRKADGELKAKLEHVIERKQDQIKAILQDFGVPLSPLPAVTPAVTPVTTPQAVAPTKAPVATKRDGGDGQRKGGS
jgi:hypothetical protein